MGFLINETVRSHVVFVYRINMDYVKVVDTKLSIEEISDLVAAPSCGAISLFVGTTRDNFNNKQVRQWTPGYTVILLK